MRGLVRRLAGRPPGTVVATTRSGELLLDAADAVVAPVIVEHGEWEPEETAFLERRLAPGQRFVDVGAHVGYFTTLAARCVTPSGRVFAFEPDARNFELLRVNVRRQQLTNVECVKAAVGERSGTVELFLAPDNPGDHRVYSTDETRRSVVVPLVALDELDIVDPPVDVVKIDVQGAEEAAFRGMERLLAESPNVAVLAEFWPWGIERFGGHPRAVLDYYRSLGFHVRALHPGSDGPVETSDDELLEFCAQLDGWQHTNLVLTREAGPRRASVRDAASAEILAEVERVPFWWHSVDLGGVVTPGHKTPALLDIEWRSLQVPDLRDKTVLDIGAWDGYFSFAAERAGAARVVALDHYVWSLDWSEAGKIDPAALDPRKPMDQLPNVWRPDTLPGKHGFDVARRALGSRVEEVVVDFMTADLDAIGTFDVVFFLGVLYHMRHPLLSLERLRRVTGELAIIESEAIAVDGLTDVPLTLFVPERDDNGDPTNWWIPTEAALVGLCRAAGFSSTEVLVSPPPAESAGPGLRRYRAVVHSRP